LTIWFFFKEISWLLALMIFVASLVLFKLAQDGLEHVHDSEKEGQKVSPVLLFLTTKIESFLKIIMKFASPIISRILPNLKAENNKTLTFWGLVRASFIIPFILGLDDFAGYVPLFSVVNVFGFGIGVFFGHCLLNILLFISPEKTIKIVKNPIISFVGSIIFILLAVYGLWEVGKILFYPDLH
jgi:hypothetical protein